jgi:LPS-assembly lipoprotein
MKKVGFNRGLLAALLTLALTACGFQFRGVGSLPFESLYVQDAGAPSIARDLKRSLKSSGVRLESAPEQAQASLELMSETFEKKILSLSSAGKVKEYDVIYRVTFRLREAGSEVWALPQTVELHRDYTYSDTELLAKDYEEAALANDMHTDAVREIMRRVGSLKRQNAATR